MLRSNPVHSIQFCDCQWRREWRYGEAGDRCCVGVVDPDRLQRRHRQHMLVASVSWHRKLIYRLKLTMFPLCVPMT